MHPDTHTPVEFESIHEYTPPPLGTASLIILTAFACGGVLAVIACGIYALCL